MNKRVIALALLLACAQLYAQPAAQPPLVVKPDAFETLVNPACSHCIDESKRRSAELRDNDRVLAWTRGHRMAAPYRSAFF